MVVAIAEIEQEPENNPPMVVMALSDPSKRQISLSHNYFRISPKKVRKKSLTGS